MSSTLVSVHEFDEIVAGDGESSFVFRLEVFQRRSDGLYWGELWRLESSSSAKRGRTGMRPINCLQVLALPRNKCGTKN
jgi:hypothetical protein